MKKYFICQRIYNKKNLLIVTGQIEVQDNFIKDRIFFEFYKDYKRDFDNSIKMALSITNVRALIYGIKEVLKKGSTQYQKITENNNLKKFLTLNQNYINASTKNLKIGIQFENPYEFLAFSDDLKKIADTVEENLFLYQKKIFQSIFH